MQNLINDMTNYYKERADEYEEWYDRKNHFDKGDELNELWFKDLAVLQKYLQEIKNYNILELAAGTGKWTRELAKNNDVYPIDSSIEVLQINESLSRTLGSVENIFELDSSLFNGEKFDLCFFGFWLSHVPHEMVDNFFTRIQNTMEVNSRVVIYDSYLNNTELNCLEHKDNIQTRVLNNGKIFKIYKKYYTKQELHEIGTKYFKSFKITYTDNYFYIFDGVLN